MLEVRLVVLPKNNVIMALKDSLKETETYKGAYAKLLDIREQYNRTAAEFERESMGNGSPESQARMRRQLPDIRRRAMKRLEPIRIQIMEAQKDLRELESHLLAEFATKRVESEVTRIREFLKELEVRDLQEEQTGHRGRLGSACVLHLCFKIDKEIMKELKHKISKANMDNIEIILEEL
jgi:hypothetical protein